MSPITLDLNTEHQLYELSQRTGKAPVQVIREALQAYAEDINDIQTSTDVLDRIEHGEEHTITLGELESRLGLDG